MGRKNRTGEGRVNRDLAVRKDTEKKQKNIVLFLLYPRRTSNEGWVELIAPISGTPEVPATPASTKYVYTLDTDGTVTDKESNAQGYLIVSSNSANAMTDSLGATDVTIENNTITLDAQPDYEWWITSDGKITDGTNYLKFTGTYQYYQASGSVSIVTDVSQATAWDIAHDGNGQYTISYDYSYRSWGTRTTTYYLRYSSGFSVINSENTVRLFSGAEVTTPATEGTPATPDKNGTYGKIVGELSYEATVGMTADEAMALVKAGIDGYYYDAMSTPDASEEGTKIEDSLLTWEWVDTFDGNTAGDYEVAIKYGDFLLGTAEVVVPASKMYYIAEGNGMYYVDMNATADTALEAVKAGVTVSSATDSNGTNKQTIDDANVTWTWVDTYNGADSGPYTVEVLYDGTSLGTVEVKVNVKYETEINPDWTYIGETEATGGTYTYTLDTDGIDADGQYIIVAETTNVALHTSGSSAATAPSVTISDTTLTTITRDYEYYWNSTYGFTRDGYNGLYQSRWAIYLGEKSASYLDGVVNHGDGTYTLYDNEGTERGLYYNGSAWTVNNGGTTTDYKVRLYKYTGSTGGTAAGSIYAKLEGNPVYTVEQGTSAYEALETVKTGITAYTATDANGTNKTEIADSELTYKWKNTYTSMVTGSYWVEISYQGVVLGTVEVQVKPGVINNYPEYPDEGAVKVSKTGTGINFQSSGIAQVEVSASGVPMKRGADVIVMLDTSSSMTWNMASGDGTRQSVMEAALKNLITQFKTPGADGNLMDIRVAIADYNGFFNSGDSPYVRDTNDTTVTTNQATYGDSVNAKVYTGDKSLGYGAFINVEDLAETYTLTTNSGTNYDYAFDAIYQLGESSRNSGEDRDLFVIFMSDGAAMQWNYYSGYGANTTWEKWITGQWKESDLTSANLNCTEHAYYYNLEDTDGDGVLNEHRMANAVKGSRNRTYEVIRKGTDGIDNISEAGKGNLYNVPGLGAKMFAICFDPAGDNQVEAEHMITSIETLASEQTGTTQYFYNVNNASALNNAFDSIGSEIAYAAYNARYVDQMGDNYDLKMGNLVDLDGNSLGVDNKIEILSYDIYTKAEADEVAEGTAGDTVTNSMIGDRKGTYKVLETVTFNAEGTEAYSSLNSTGPNGTITAGQNILIDGVIYANTFWYNANVNGVAIEGVDIPTGVNADGTTKGSTNVLPSETFYWKLGTVQSSELAMRYYVYLEGSMEGTCEAGSYPTNEYATLYYDNYLYNPCYRETVSPVMAWESANVSYAFYLVNEKGEIIVNQTTGETGSFANKIAVTNPVVYQEILLNNTDVVNSIEVASSGVLPTGYDLYDPASVYTIKIDSDSTGEWIIEKGTDTDTVASTYVTHHDPNNVSAYTNALSSKDSADYTHTVVWFAVLWKVQALPDAVVIDYGLPVDISVLANDMFGENGKLAGVGAYSDDLNLDGHDTDIALGFGKSYTGTYGKATTDTAPGKVRYTPSNMEMNGYDKFAYAVNYTGNENVGYYYDTVTVIPATTIYYEDDFLEYDNLTWQQKEGGQSWEGEWAVVENPTTSMWTKEGTTVEGATQAEDRPGQYSLTDANNIYGYDGVNNGMSTYSLGSAMKATVDYDNGAQASFEFYGTGFDVVSLTSNTTGMILVYVYPVNTDGTLGTAVKSLTVDTYYGYTQEAGDADGDGIVVDGEMVWVVDPDADDTLYQVPVMEVANLEYGHYKAVIQAVYEPAFDHVDSSTSGTYDFYLDAIRIYDPANDGAADGTTDTVIEDAYKADGEGWPSYIELRNKLIDAETLGNTDTTTTITGVVFIDGDAEVGDAQISDYTSYGPNNEVYLAPGQSVAFLLNTPSNIKNVHIGIKSADGNTGTYTITNIAQKADSENKIVAGQCYGADTKTINTTTDMYYNLTGWKNDIIVITNTGDIYNTTGIISLTNIKSTYTSDPNSVMTTSLEDEEINTNETYVYMTAEAATLTLRTLNTSVEETPDTEETPEEFVPEKFEVSLSNDSVTVGQDITVNVITSIDVVSVEINDQNVTEYTTDENGDRVWTTVITAETVGTMEISVTATNQEGVVSEAVVKNLEVKEKNNSLKDWIEDIIKKLFGKWF